MRRLHKSTMSLRKETKPARSPHGRWYRDACGTAFGLELLGERWSLLIVRELMFGPRRFSDIRANLPGLSAKVLTERLNGLETHGVIIRSTAPEPVPTKLYGLTEWGYAAEPIINELGRWAAASPMHDPTLPLSPASFMLSLRTMLNVEAAEGMTAVVQFSIGTANFAAHLQNGTMPVTRGEIDTPDLHFTAPAAPLLAVVFYGDEVPDTVDTEITGNTELCRRFIDLFELPTQWTS